MAKTLVDQSCKVIDIQRCILEAETHVSFERSIGVRWAVRHIEGKWILLDCDSIPCREYPLPKFPDIPMIYEKIANILNCGEELAKGYDVCGLEEELDRALNEVPREVFDFIFSVSPLVGCFRVA